MAHIDGIELLRRLRQKSDVPVILLNDHADEADELAGLRIGADDVILKPFSPPVLVERVYAVLRRPRQSQLANDHHNGEAVIECGHLRMNKDGSCSWKGRAVELTVTEFRLLESLAVRPGITKSRDVLMEITSDAVAKRTIDTHIKHIRQKFRAVDRTFDEIKPLYRIGYRFLPSKE
jgi:two-component system response regulator ChvI